MPQSLQSKRPNSLKLFRKYNLIRHCVKCIKSQIIYYKIWQCFLLNICTAEFCFKFNMFCLLKQSLYIKCLSFYDYIIHFQALNFTKSFRESLQCLQVGNFEFCVKCQLVLWEHMKIIYNLQTMFSVVFCKRSRFIVKQDGLWLDERSREEWR